MKLIDLFNEILKEADDFKITRDGCGRVASKIANIGKQLTPGFIRSPKEYKGIGGARLANKNVDAAADSIGFKIPRSKETRDEDGGTVKGDKITISFSTRNTYSGFQYLKVSVGDYQKIKEIFNKGKVIMKSDIGKPDLFYVNFYPTNNKYLVSFNDIFYNKKSPTSGVIYTPNTYDMGYLTTLDLNDIVDKNRYKKFQFPLVVINKP
jgi:hypothetical protein